MLKKEFRSAGGVVVGPQRKIVLMQHQEKSWSFPKGRIKEGEDLLETAKREITEETGITELQLLDDLGEYKRTHIHKPDEMRVIHLFLFKTPTKEILPNTEDAIAAKWFDINQVSDRLTHEKDKRFFEGIVDRVRYRIVD